MGLSERFRPAPRLSGVSLNVLGPLDAFGALGILSHSSALSWISVGLKHLALELVR